ncbi:MbnP family protein [Phaeocystidibacter luteus]|uniref:Copper-binding protein MbnP-like domain-containing protein n=1 Tax=Phaeocystidibacter luteus TaxID=911197 RepID=A0A6N6RMJ4_9FLAO|nr:MbnP family protein [Phaeocystidibacter luteus]KAB2814817.1 hypothetical protein F8C67_03450 [Phaeocystidibacter luteus]
MKKILATLVLASLLLTGCKDDPEPGSMMVRFSMNQNGEAVNLNETFGTDSVAALRIEALKFYISSLKLNGHGQLAAVEVVDFSEGRVDFTFNNIEAGSYSGLNFTLGLSEDQNASNPIDYATGHPLSASWGLYWSWAMKYRFVLLEGRGATDGTIDGSSSDFFIALHPGADGLSQYVNLDQGITVSEGTTVIYDVAIDVDELWDGPGGYIDLPNENQSHTTPSDYYLAEKFIENFAAAMHKR